MLNLALLYQVICVAVLSAASAIFWPAGALGVLAGGLLMAGNFWALKTVVTRLLGGAGQGKLIWGLLLAIKFAVLLALMGLMILVLDLNALGIALGMFSFFVGVTLGYVHVSLSPVESANKG